VSANKTFAGLENYANLVSDRVFWISLLHNVVFMIVGGTLILVVALAVAHAIQSNHLIARAIRGVYLLPHILSLVIVAIIWTFIYNPSFGLLTGTLKSLGAEHLSITWLGDGRTVLGAVILAFVWYALGFYIMLFSTGIKAVPEEVKEASQLDGAQGLRRFLSITWPLLWPVRRIAIINLVIASLNVFAIVYLMTEGGPDRKTEVTLTYLYEQGFRNSQYGYAASIAVANLVVVFLLTGLVMLGLRRNPEVGRAA
jgi:N-acetylglucosamine transport system permease protein